MTIPRLRALDCVDVAGLRVLIRADLNVPMANGVVSDRARLQRFAPTVKGLVDRGARVIVASHLGRPIGRESSLSLRPIAQELAAELRTTVTFVPECVGSIAQEAIARLSNGSVALLENLRFYAQEERNDPHFAESLATLADVYVNDAFSCSHRAHSSIDKITQYLPAFAGPSLLAEITALSAALASPHRPVIAIVGGSKVSSKLAVLENLVGRVDRLAIGGAMANTFLAAHGHTVGRSLFERSQIDVARAIEVRAKQCGCQLILPRDVVTASAICPDARTSVVPIDQVPADQMILDIGPLSVADLTNRMADCRTILWNGPLGAFEVEPFGDGTFATARSIADFTSLFGITSIAGGGDTVSALNAAGVTHALSYVSTAGGAFLEWLEGKRLPGVEALIAEREMGSL